MSSSPVRPSFPDDLAIDRLVDGELPEDERRAVLLRLEADPEAWRRCALAFLEAQAWGKALEPAASIVSRPPLMSMPPDSTPLPMASRWSRRVVIAASLLASTFLAGYAAGGRTKGEPRVVVADAGTVEPPGDSVGAVSEEIREVGSFQVVDTSAGESPPRQFPIFEGPGLNDRWLSGQPSMVPDHVRARWERQGYRIEERRKLVSVELEDGRHVSIPVDEVEVGYVGQQPL